MCRLPPYKFPSFRFRLFGIPTYVYFLSFIHQFSWLMNIMIIDTQNEHFCSVFDGKKVLFYWLENLNKRTHKEEFELDWLPNDKNGWRTNHAWNILIDNNKNFCLLWKLLWKKSVVYFNTLFNHNQSSIFLRNKNQNLKSAISCYQSLFILCVCVSMCTLTYEWLIRRQFGIFSHKYDKILFLDRYAMRFYALIML